MRVIFLVAFYSVRARYKLYLTFGEVEPLEMPSYKSRRVIDPAQQAALEVVALQFGRANAENSRMAELRHIVPFDYFAMSGIASFGLGVGRGVMLASDMPEGFIRHFLAENLYHKDPLSYMITPDRHWGRWSDLEPEFLAGPGIKRIRELELSYQITPRTVVGFFDSGQRYGGVTFCREAHFTDAEKFILEMTTRVVHAELSDQLVVAMNQHVGLSHGELVCLEQFADGTEVGGIAAATGYTTDTIYTFAKTAARKLGVRGRTHAACEALRRKLIK